MSPRRPSRYSLILCNNLERCWCSQYLAENVFLPAERLNPTLCDNQNMIDAIKRFRSMRDDDDYSASASHTQYGSSEGLFTVGIEIRRRLIEHHEKGITIERTGESDTLTLTGRKRHPPFTNLGRVSIGEGENEIVRARRASCFQYAGRSCLQIEARNIDCDAAIKQLDVLRQVADVT